MLLSKGLCVPREDLDVIFMRLDTQKVQMVGTRPMSLPPVTSNAHPGFHPNIPAAFESMEEARNNLEYHWNLCLSTALNFEHIDLIRQGTEQQEHREAYERDRIYFQNEYKRWKSAFQAFLNANIANMDSKALRGAMVLKLSAHVAAMHLEITAFDILRYQTAFDELLPMYKELVELVAAIIDAESTPDNASKLKPIFQMDQSIITPLFAAAHKCRDPYVRRRAIALLYKVPRQEGVWNSILTARCAERIVKIEEEGLGDVKCCADVPDSVRISDVEVAFDLQQRRGFIKFSRLRSFYPTVREPITDVFEW